MKFTFLTLLIIVCVIPLNSQDDKGINVIKDAKIDFLIEEYKSRNLSKDSEKGYRIQIILSDTREEVNKEKTKFYQSFPEMNCYIVYDQPYYKLRVGDFKTRMEAKKTLLTVADIYPTAFIVNDDINVRN